MARPPRRPTPVPDPVSPPPPKPESDYRRLSFLLNKDGSPAVDRMHADTRQQLRDLLQSPAARSALGLNAPPGVSVELPPFVGVALAQAVATIDYVIVQKATGAPRHVMDDVGKWTPDEESAIAPSLLSVLNKYSGTWLTTYGEEFALGTVLITTTIAKIEAVRDAMKRDASRGPRVVPITPVAPTPPPPAPTPEPETPAANGGDA